MDKLSLTYFVDFVNKAGTPKLTIVRNFKERDDYDPATDFYKAAREEIVEMYTKGRGKESLDAMLRGLKDVKKITAYPEIVAGYKRFLGNKGPQWFSPPTGIWNWGGLDVSVNPEVGLAIDGIPHVLKLYFKEEDLTKNRATLTLLRCASA